jgi:hypothetical protein
MKARVRGDEYATYHIGIVVKEEYKNKEKLSISDTDVSVYAPLFVIRGTTAAQLMHFS